LMISDSTVQECDARNDEKRTKAGNKKIVKNIFIKNRDGDVGYNF